MRRKTIRVCPNCGSADIEYASMVRQSGAITGLGLPEQYFCKACGYRGSVVLEVDQAKIKRMKFTQFARVRKWKPIEIIEPMKLDRRAFEIIKPVFSVTVLLFFLAAVFLLIPQGVYQKEIVKEHIFTFNNTPTFLTIEGRPILLPTESTIQAYKTPQGMAIVETQETPTGTRVYLTVLNATPTQLLERSTGIGAATGFILPLFLLFLISGVLVMLFWVKWKRLTHFWQ